jgi:hypothetical protein
LWIIVLSIDWSKVKIVIIIIIIITFSFSFQHLETTNIQLRWHRHGVVVRYCQSPSQILILLLEKGTLIWCRSTGTWPHIHRKKHRTKGGMEHTLEEHACGTRRLFVWQNIKSSGHISPFLGCSMLDVVICGHCKIQHQAKLQQEKGHPTWLPCDLLHSLVCNLTFHHK